MGGACGGARVVGKAKEKARLANALTCGGPSLSRGPREGAGEACGTESPISSNLKRKSYSATAMATGRTAAVSAIRQATPVRAGWRGADGQQKELTLAAHKKKTEATAS